MQNASPARAWFAWPLLTCPAADIKEDGVSISLTQLPDRLVQSFCSTRVHLEKGIWRDAKFQAEQIFKDVWLSIKELEGRLLMGTARHGARRTYKTKTLLGGSVCKEVADCHWHSWCACLLLIQMSIVRPWKEF